MSFGIWQIVYLSLFILTIGIDLAKHGEPKTGNHNVFVTMIASAIGISILYFGGFFS